MTLDELHARLQTFIPGYEEVTVTIAEQLRSEGRAEGRVAGRAEGRIAVLRRQLELKFGRIAPELERELAAAGEAELDRYAERVLTATAIEAVFEA